MNYVAAPPFVPGLYHDMPAPAYHAIEAMSSSGAKKMIRSPQHYREAIDHPSPPIASMQLGSALHAMVLEPERQCIKIGPGSGGKGKAWDEFVATCASDSIILTAEQFEAAQRMRDNILAHPAASRLLDGARTEISGFWIDPKYGVPCKLRTDAFLPGRAIMSDLKSAADASPDGFGRAAATFGYHIQEAWYRAGWEQLTGEQPRAFCFLVVENEEPYAVACYTLPDNAVAAGRAWCDLALERYARALASGEWAGYPQTVSVVPFPQWATRVNIA